MSSYSAARLLWWRILALSFLVAKSLGLNADGAVLLSFKYSILNDPLGVLQSWNYSDQIPCSWNGVTCGGPRIPNASLRVTGLSLPNCQLLGSISADLGMLEHLQNLDLSSNSLNGSFPVSLLYATQLRVLDLSNNSISGGLPGSVGLLQNLESLNLSDNALAGTLPVDLGSLHNLTVVSLNNNYLSGSLPSGFETVQVLDLSSNLINGSLPLDFGGNSLSYFNISHNKLSGPIPPAFASQISSNCTIDFSFNSLTGEIPDSSVFLNQKSSAYAGNQGICSPPDPDQCPLPSSPFPLTNVSAPTSPPAIAAVPKIIASTAAITQPSGDSQTASQKESGLRPGSIIGIIIGDIAGFAILGILFFYVYQCLKKKKNVETAPHKKTDFGKEDNWSSASSESRGFTRWSCLRKRGDNDEDSEPTSSDDEEDPKVLSSDQQHQQEQHQRNNRGTLVTIDGSEKELELETLLKASAYILGATSSSIMYKAVLEDGTALAVRRIGESHTERFREFENQVRVIAKLVHPNLVRIRGFYWGVDEKLIIYDFVPNGSLADARYRKAGSSPCHLPWEARLKIAKGVARGLAFLHDKKHVHANLKPANIILSSDMEPRIGDFGLERLVTGGDTSWKAGGSVRNFGSKRSTASRDSFPDLIAGPSPSPSPSSIGGLSPYHAPESLRSLKPSPKWDVYSFGAIFLELLTGKVIVVDELGQGSNGLVVEDKNRALRMVDVAIRADVEGKEDALLACFKLGYSCASPSPLKRPTMKEALQVLDKVPTSTSYFHGPF